MALRNCTLELSLKPFYDQSPEAIAAVCRELFFQWRRMIDAADTVSVLFWAADGSEILDYRGNLGDRFEWAKYIGVANPHGGPSGLAKEHQSVHENPLLYRDNPPAYTYADFKRVLDTMRAVWSETQTKPLTLGATFDSGPEFAVSDFKYKRHPEICRGHCLGGRAFVCCYLNLNADNIAYAGFPQGIPQNTTLGTFLGRQTACYTRDMGFDYVWFSNGFGFGMETWGACGAVFDGEAFHTGECNTIRDAMLDFWRDFRKECPDLPVETRGTNLSTGMDLASDAVPLREIYREVKGMEVPPNSPWAALNGDFGLEITGWLSHIAELPEGKGFPFRFYTHDPWFLNSPWLDRYARSEHDIVLPLALTRLDGEGNAQIPSAVKFLTADDSFGQMPRKVPDEVAPLILHSLDTAPDRAGPLVWVYPFEEYHDLVYRQNRADEVFFGDWYLRTAVEGGLPLNSVISTGNFLCCHEKLRSNVLVVPTVATENPQLWQALLTAAQNGGKVLLYGPLAAGETASALGLQFAPELSGDCTLTRADAHGLTRCAHRPLFSAGGLTATAQDSAAQGLQVLADYQIGSERRTAALVKSFPGGGKIGWLRGTNSFTFERNGNRPEFLPRTTYAYPEDLILPVLAELGYAIEQRKYEPQQATNVLLWRQHANALYLAGHAPDATVGVALRLPEGAPLFTSRETVLQDGKALYHLGKAANWECRILVDQQEGLLRCKEETVIFPRVKRRLSLHGLKNATITFRPEPGREDTTRFLLNPRDPYTVGDFLTPETVVKNGVTTMTVRNVTGPFMIYW